LAQAAESWIEVRYEDLVNDLEKESRRVLEFLALSWNPPCSVLRARTHEGCPLPSYLDVVSPVYKRAVGRWRNYQAYLEPYLEKLDPFLKLLGYEREPGA